MWVEVDSQAKMPSSSSLLLGAGSGAPEPSVVGSCTYPSPNGFSDFMEDSRPRCSLVFTGGSSRLDHPRLFIESRKDEDAMFAGCGRCILCNLIPAWCLIAVSERRRIAVPAGWGSDRQLRNVRRSQVGEVVQS